jgi:hypothetical protein
MNAVILRVVLAAVLVHAQRGRRDEQGLGESGQHFRHALGCMEASTALSFLP